MKIVSVRTVQIRPRWAIIVVETDDGIQGVGEAVLEGRTRTVATAIDELQSILIGQDPRRIEFLWQTIFRGTFYRGGPILASALSAVDQALWDIFGKAVGLPVYQLLGGAVRDRVRVYSHIRGEAPEALAADARARVADGFTGLKTSVGKAHILESRQWIDQEVSRIAAVREAVGSGADLALDFHGRVAPALAVTLAHELEPYNLLFIEEPTPPENVDALVAIRPRLRQPVACGERVYTRWGFREYFEKHAMDIAQPDLAHCGGISEARRIAAMAEPYYVGFAPHNPLGPVNFAASLAVSAAVPNFLMMEQVTMGEGYLVHPFEAVDGYIPLPTAPGLGIEVDWDAIARQAYDGSWDTPRWLHDDDGSYADW